MMMQDVRQNVEDLLPSLFIVVVVIPYNYCISPGHVVFFVSSLLAKG
jgi:hypothetical protein